MKWIMWIKLSSSAPFFKQYWDYCANSENIKSLVLCARQLRMEISTCALINHIVLNNTKESKSSKHCENSNDLKHPTATPIITSMSIQLRLEIVR